MRILLIEDEEKIANFIKRGLKEELFVVDAANDGMKGIEMAVINPYDLIILDLMLPKKDGLSVCKELRDKKIETPILILTAKDSIKDKVIGLNNGADDYLTKPFAFDEFLARVRALLRRNNSAVNAKLKTADLELDMLTHKVTRGGQNIELTGKEYALLEYLMLNANNVVTRTMISEHVWNEDFDSFTNVFDVFIHRLRAKIDKGFGQPLIHSLRGVGYVLGDENK